jgi:mRNA interferase MazF
MPLVPQRSHIYVVALDLRVGTKPGRQRPCLAIQPRELGEAGLPSTVVLPLTTKVVREHAFPLRVRIPAGVCGLARDSDVLVDQMLACDNELFRRDFGPVPEAVRDDLRRVLLEFLDLLSSEWKSNVETRPHAANL